MRISIMGSLIGLLQACAWLHPAIAASATPPAIGVVAAENVYGEIAHRLGVEHVSVTSILGNPDQDPHLFEVGPGVARAIAGAGIVIRNGLGYDPWMGGLLAARGHAPAAVLTVAELAGRHDGDNPHLWYDPAVMPVLARALSATFTRLDPADAPFYAARLSEVSRSIAPVNAQVAALRARYAGTPVTATEPVFGEMAKAIGLEMRNNRFQLAVMNDTEPAAADVAAMETDLRTHRVRLLITNRQASNSAAERLVRIARDSGVPIVGVTETEPAGLDYAGWMLGQLDAVAAALASGPGSSGAPGPSAERP